MIKDETSLQQQPQGDQIDVKKRRDARSTAIAWALFGLALMFFLVTIVKLSSLIPPHAH